MIKEKDIIVKFLTILFPESIIYLFGSHARGDNIEHSDVDIAIDNQQKLSLRERA
jgi:predicted nucleotidyltransferase